MHVNSNLIANFRMMKNLSTRIETICISIWSVFVCVSQFVHFDVFSFCALMTTKEEPWEYAYQAQSTVAKDRIAWRNRYKCQRNSRECYAIHELSTDHKSSQQFPSFAKQIFHSKIIYNLFNLSHLIFFSAPKNGRKWQKKMKNYFKKMTENEALSRKSYKKLKQCRKKNVKKLIEKCAKMAEATSCHWSRFSQVRFMVILMTIIESNGSDKTSIFICHPAKRRRMNTEESVSCWHSGTYIFRRL